MNAINIYWTGTKNEFLKLKRTFAFWLTIISAFFYTCNLFNILFIKV